MSTTRKNDSTTVIRVATCSALALILSGTPVVIDLTNGPSVEWSDTYAKSCFIAGTQVHMADGSVKPIELVRIGDRVLGQDGVVNTVREIERRRLGGRRLYRLNDSRAFVTAEHPFMTTDGWSAINPLMTARENSALKVRRLTLGAKLARLVTAVPADAVGSGLNLAPTAALQWQTLVVLEATDAAPSTAVFNLLLDGDHSYFADGFLVHNKDGGEGGEGGEGEGGGEGGESGSGEGGESGSGSGAGEGGESGGESGAGDGGESGGGSGAGEGGESGGESGAGEAGESGAGESGESGDRRGAGESGESGGALGEAGAVSGNRPDWAGGAVAQPESSSLASG